MALVMDPSEVDKGGCISLVLEVVSLDPGHERHLLVDRAHNKLVQYAGLVEGGHKLITVIDAVLVRQFPVVCLECGEKTKVLHHGIPTWSDYFKMIDACSGLGGISHGALAVGIFTTVATDVNARMSELHKVHVCSDHVTGDIGDPQVVAEVWSRSSSAALMCAGFSCQPFSQLGDRRGGLDPRAQTLPKLLRAAHLLQIKVLVLECVVPARSDPFVKQQLDCFASLMGFTTETVNLDLQTVWPCRRHRTWWLLFDSSLGKMGLSEWPVLDSLPTVQCLIPYICKWDPRDEMALSLDSSDRQAFGVDDGTYPHYLLDAEGVAPTALHAWGSQLRGCPCGCRDYGLSPTRLREKGLFGLLVSSCFRSHR